MYRSRRAGAAAAGVFDRAGESVVTLGIGGCVLLCGVLSVCCPAHRRLKKRFAPGRFLWMGAEAYDAAFAILATGDGRGALHDAERGVVFPHLGLKRGQRLVVVDVVFLAWREQRSVFEMDRADLLFWLQCFLADGSKPQLYVALAAGPMGAVDDFGIEHAQRPGVLGGREIRAGANADESAAAMDELCDGVAAFVP